MALLQNKNAVVYGAGGAIGGAVAWAAGVDAFGEHRGEENAGA